jgi:hypothetical protein
MLLTALVAIQDSILTPQMHSASQQPPATIHAEDAQEVHMINARSALALEGYSAPVRAHANPDTKIQEL